MKVLIAEIRNILKRRVSSHKAQRMNINAEPEDDKVNKTVDVV